MSIEEIYTLEIEGISDTILEYTVNHYIKSYSKQLKQLSLPQDYQKIHTIITRLSAWYEESIDQITNSKFVMNKEDHIKTKTILTRLQKELDRYTAG